MQTTKYYKNHGITPELKAEIINIIDERINTVHVTREDFSELKEIVRKLSISIEELTEAQKESEARLTRVETALAELAEAQKRTEIKVEQLAEAQKRTEIKVEQLAVAQKESEARLTRVETALAELAEALNSLTQEHTKTRKELGGLSATVGYRLEDEAFKALPELLKNDFNIIIEEKIRRRYVTLKNGEFIEVNILAAGKQDGKDITIIGESKSQLSKNKVDEFIRKKLLPLKEIYSNIFPVLVTYMISEPDAEEYAKGKGIKVYYSYDF